MLDAPFRLVVTCSYLIYGYIIITQISDCQYIFIKFSVYVGVHNVERKSLYKSLNIADMIKARAKEKKVALKDMLVDLELGSNTMSNMRHDRMIAADSLARIADYLDCSVDYLLGRTDNPEINK